MRAIRAFFLVASGIVLSANLALAQDQSNTGDAVADAARKAREAKKDAPKPKKVFTDEDIVRAKPLADPAAATSAAANPDDAPAAKPANDGGAKSSGKSEAAWRKEFVEQHKKISDVQLELDVLQREAQKADVQYYSDPQKAMNEQFSRKEINEKNDKIAAKKKELADLQQHLSDMEDELKRTGGDPGWAR
jgi:chromosome segregation ATPase